MDISRMLVLKKNKTASLLRDPCWLSETTWKRSPLSDGTPPCLTVERYWPRRRCIFLPRIRVRLWYNNQVSLSGDWSRSTFSETAWSLPIRRTLKCLITRTLNVCGIPFRALNRHRQTRVP